MSTARYGFLPWFRKGLATKYDRPLSATSETGRLDFNVTLNLQGVTPLAPIQKTITLRGPGDIIGIDKRMVVRTEPANGVFSYEANYLAYIEFLDEDFLWRYTPASPEGQKLPSWLALIVLKDNEYAIKEPAKDGLPPIVDITAPFFDVFHDPARHAVFAHVHVNNPKEGATSQADLINQLKLDHAKDPAAAISRLLCSRQLAKNTSYTAFVIPAYETGRLAGIGDDTVVPELKSSWDANNAHGRRTEFPIYYQWRFGTSATGDFETLARAIKPIAAPPQWAGREMDISQSGMGLDDLFSGSTPPMPDKTVLMEGALIPPAYSPAPAKNATSTDAYTQWLRDKILNLQQSLTQSGFTGAANPYSPSLGDVIDDPVVLPPIYGQWHANVQKLDTNSPGWIQELNLDTRYRAAAGLGAKVIRDKQEEYMERAWKQVGAVIEANEKIKLAQLALQASKRIYSKHVVGKLRSQSVSAETKIDLLIKGVTPALKKIITNAGSAESVAARSNITKGGADTGFRKIARNNSQVVKRISPVNGTENIIGKMNFDPASFTAAAPVVPVSENFELASYAVSTSRREYKIADLSIYDQSRWIDIYNQQLEEMKNTILYFDYLEVTYTDIPLPVNIIVGDYVGNILHSLEPDNAVGERARKMILLQTETNITAISGLDPIMAYPVFEDAMYEELIHLSLEHLLPNSEKYPNNTVTVLDTNTRFIEAYMAGLNHEFSRELLWREYPTDQRGSYFRKFWSVNDTPIDPGYVPPNPNDKDYFFDIKPMHQWGGVDGQQNPIRLGGNHTQGRHDKSTKPKTVFLIRADLFRKYPNTLVYMQKGIGASPPRSLASVTFNNGVPNPSLLKFPIFKANLNSDLLLVGFDVETDVAKGVNGDGGWFIVFKERPGQLRFGLEEFRARQDPNVPVSQAELNNSWNNLAWNHMDGARVLDVALLDDIDMAPKNDNMVHAATLASILYKRPVTIAIHADDMIY